MSGEMKKNNSYNFVGVAGTRGLILLMMIAVMTEGWKHSRKCIFYEKEWRDNVEMVSYYFRFCQV